MAHAQPIECTVIITNQAPTPADTETTPTVKSTYAEITSRKSKSNQKGNPAICNDDHINTIETLQCGTASMQRYSDTIDRYGNSKVVNHSGYSPITPDVGMQDVYSDDESQHLRFNPAEHCELGHQIASIARSRHSDKTSGPVSGASRSEDDSQIEFITTSVSHRHNGNRFSPSVSGPPNTLASTNCNAHPAPRRPHDQEPVECPTATGRNGNNLHIYSQLVIRFPTQRRTAVATSQSKRSGSPPYSHWCGTLVNTTCRLTRKTLGSRNGVGCANPFYHITYPNICAFWQRQ